VNGKFKLLLLLIPASLSALYFPTVSGLDTNIISKDLLIMVPLQVLALVYVGYHYYRRK
jgi:hypothetical protein